MALEYVDPKDAYPSGWQNLQGKVVQTKATIQETWTAMEHIADLGLAKSIAVSNFQGALLMDLLRYARIRPALLQVEIHPYLAQTELVEYAQMEGITVTAYSSFGPQSFIELKWDKATQCPPLFQHPVVNAIAEKHGKTAAQVLLRWSTQRNIIVIPKATRADLVVQNLESLTFDLSPEELSQITALNRNLRFNNPPDVSFLLIFNVTTLKKMSSTSVFCTSSLRVVGLVYTQSICIFIYPW